MNNPILIFGQGKPDNNNDAPIGSVYIDSTNLPSGDDNTTNIIIQSVETAPNDAGLFTIPLPASPSIAAGATCLACFGENSESAVTAVNTDGKSLFVQSSPWILKDQKTVVHYLAMPKDSALNALTTDSPSQSPYQIGDVKIWPSEKIPDGWAELNGATFDETKYPEAAKFWGAAQLPDWRNRVVRGAGDLIKPGEMQEDAAQRITGYAAVSFFSNIPPTYPREARGAITKQELPQFNTFTLQPRGGITASTLGFDNSKSENARTADETRVKAVGVLFITYIGKSV